MTVDDLCLDLAAGNPEARSALAPHLSRSTVRSEGSLADELVALLSEEEAAATLARVETLLVEDSFPAPGTDRPLPWPLI